MKDRNKKALIYSAVGMASVLITAFITDFLAPQNQLGEGLRFAVPLLAGIISGGLIFLRLREDLDYSLQDLEDSED